MNEYLKVADGPVQILATAAWPLAIQATAESAVELPARPVERETPAAFKQCSSDHGQQDKIARAEGLSEADALALAAWLTSTGYHEIVVEHVDGQSSVRWQK